MAGLRVIRAGVAATVQDRGRAGYRGFGVPVGGSFDRRSSDLANALVGNEADCAALELTLVGGVFRAEIPLAIALAGAPMAAEIRRGPEAEPRPLVVPQSAALEPGDELHLGGTVIGARTYVAVRGGWRTPLVLGSRSDEARLRAGDLLPAAPGSTPARRPAAWPWAVGEGGPIRVVDGPDAEASLGGASFFESAGFVVSPRSDRMGLRLEGPTITVDAPPDRPSAPVAPGAVQVAGGRAIVLGVAGGTIGGYVHLAHVISPDLDRLAQARPGDRLTFRRVDLAEARRLDQADRRAQAAWLAPIRAIAASR